MVELNHQLQISQGKAFVFRQLILQINRKPGEDTRSPSFGLLPCSDHAPNVPIQGDHFRIGIERGTVLGLADAGLDVTEEVSVESEFFLLHRLRAFMGKR